MSPLLNDPYYETIGVGTRVWLAGAQGHVYAEGTQHAGGGARTPNGVPMEGAGTLALTADMKQMRPEFVRGVSFRGYGVSLALGVGIPIPILNEEILKRTCVRDRDILAPVIDYSPDYPQKTGKVIGHVNYEQLRSGEIEVDGKKVEVGSLSSYYKALEIANLLADEIRRGDFLLAAPIAPLPQRRQNETACEKGAAPMSVEIVTRKADVLLPQVRVREADHLSPGQGLQPDRQRLPRQGDAGGGRLPGAGRHRHGAGHPGRHGLRQDLQRHGQLHRQGGDLGRGSLHALRPLPPPLPHRGRCTSTTAPHARSRTTKPSASSAWPASASAPSARAPRHSKDARRRVSTKSP